ncbi:TetR/AcrR family transcriptional regulator [Henriciella sp. AS95]|uniref:TetR/AcrR family transcriptional regulator n=1 Tax=Henriciella sp. AS95 TaxID=3135782 RepID=UPI00317A0161
MTGAEKRREARCDQVLDAASACFVAHGFHGAGMAKIAKRAKMSVGHIYHYFESKEAIIAALVDRESELVAERFAELESLPSDELAAAMVNRAEDIVATKSDAFQSALNLEIQAEAQRNPQIAAIIQSHDTHVRSLLSNMISNKLGLTDADTRTELLMSLFGGLASRVLRNPSLQRDELIPLFKELMQTLLHEPVNS